MIEADRAAFDRAFGRVSGGFRLKLGTTERTELARIYFRVLDAFPVEVVTASVRGVLAKYKRFPTAADWLADLEALTPAPPARPLAAQDARVWSTSERAEYLQAERQRFADLPCNCLTCQAAEITDRPVRFVPTLLHDGTEDRAYDEQKHVLVIVGHWAHGAELARWYTARAGFFAAVPRRVRRLVLAAVGAEREPGEEG